jgi:hypothetical protein
LTQEGASSLPGNRLANPRSIARPFSTKDHDPDEQARELLYKSIKTLGLCGLAMSLRFNLQIVEGVDQM